MDISATELALLIVGWVLAAVGLLGAGLLWASLRKTQSELAAAEQARDAATADAAGQTSRAELAETRLTEATDARNQAQAEADASTRRVLELSTDLAAARERLEAAARDLAQRDTLEARFRDAFKALSADALKTGREEFIAAAKPVFDAATKQSADEMEKRREAVERMVKPIGETLTQTRTKLEEMEKARLSQTAAIQQQITAMTGASSELRDETSRLTRALSRPEIRGQYGEIQLRRVAELAGMVDYCDFSEQTSVRDDMGALLRPDMVVKLPNERVIAVDAKTNTYAYLEAANARDDAEREAALDRFARHVSEQARKLGDKKYWAAFDQSPEFVVMFIPGDQFIDAALSRKPDLLEVAAQQGVIMASPSTLIGLLRAVAVGWREHTLAEHAKELTKLGAELHERAAAVFDHAASLGKTLGQTVDRYNKMVGSIDTRLSPTLRRFEEHGARSAKELVEPKPVDAGPRLIQSGTEQSLYVEPENQLADAAESD